MGRDCLNIDFHPVYDQANGDFDSLVLKVSEQNNLKLKSQPNPYTIPYSKHPFWEWIVNLKQAECRIGICKH